MCGRTLISEDDILVVVSHKVEVGPVDEPLQRVNIRLLQLPVIRSYLSYKPHSLHFPSVLSCNSFIPRTYIHLKGGGRPYNYHFITLLTTFFYIDCCIYSLGYQPRVGSWDRTEVHPADS